MRQSDKHASICFFPHTHTHTHVSQLVIPQTPHAHSIEMHSMWYRCFAGHRRAIDRLRLRSFAHLAAREPTNRHKATTFRAQCCRLHLYIRMHRLAVCVNWSCSCRTVLLWVAELAFHLVEKILCNRLDVYGLGPTAQNIYFNKYGFDFIVWFLYTRKFIDCIGNQSSPIICYFEFRFVSIVGDLFCVRTFSQRTYGWELFESREGENLSERLLVT